MRGLRFIWYDGVDTFDFAFVEARRKDGQPSTWERTTINQRHALSSPDPLTILLPLPLTHLIHLKGIQVSLSFSLSLAVFAVSVPQRFVFLHAVPSRDTCAVATLYLGLFDL